jgi:hypothetical protein
VTDFPEFFDQSAILVIEMNASVRYWFDRPALYAALDDTVHRASALTGSTQRGFKQVTRTERLSTPGEKNSAKDNQQ